jgi:hypothetical protein
MGALLTQLPSRLVIHRVDAHAHERFDTALAAYLGVGGTGCSVIPPSAWRAR